jgi:YD repeat-containing protein
MEQHYYYYGYYYEDLCQRVTYTYDSNPVNPYFSNYALGRLTTAQYGDPSASPGTCSIAGASFTGGAYTEMYSYHPAGGVTAKRLQVLRPSENDLFYASEWPDGSNTQYESGTLALDVDYTYDTAGRRNSITYPNVAGQTFDMGGMGSFGVNLPSPVTLTTTYDSMGRLASLKDSFGQTWVNSTSYDVANRMTSMAYPGGTAYGVTETMSYNVNGQLASRNWSVATSPYTSSTTGLAYSYSATQNNGQITQMVDTMSGETVTYAYDALKRLMSASSTPISGSSPTAWTQSYQYDGFGNLTGKTLNGTTTAIGIDPATNRQSGPGYDNNGNMLAGGSYSYDGRNRFVSTSYPYGESYFYDSQNRRVYQNHGGGPGQITL